jgi:hypothetical protein
MFSIHYVVSRENDHPVDRVTFGGDNLSDAIARAIEDQGHEYRDPDGPDASSSV